MLAWTASFMISEYVCLELLLLLLRELLHLERVRGHPEGIHGIVVALAVQLHDLEAQIIGAGGGIFRGLEHGVGHG